MQFKVNENPCDLDLNDLAPISITVYTRLAHLRECIESLLHNPLAKYSCLYVFSDAARPGDESAVEEVRAYLDQLTGFKKVYVIKQRENNHKKNNRDAGCVPREKHGKIIRMEDDNVVSPYFLSFMNQALEYYRDDPSVVSISGYAPPIRQEEYISDDVYLSHFYSAWTTATWANTPLSDWRDNDKPYSDMIENELEDVVSDLHPKLHIALKRMENGGFIAGDQLNTYFMIKNNVFQIRPVKSLVKNIGHDGTGMHCGVSTRFQTDFFAGYLDPVLKQKKYLPEIDRMQYRFFHPHKTIFKRLIGKLRRELSAIFR